MKEIKVCPFCGEEETIVVSGNSYHCNCCERNFTIDDFKHEILRQKISSICSAEFATEENPISCVSDDVMELHIEGIDEEAQGLSESEKPQVTNIFLDGEGIVWATIDGDVIDIDDLLTISLEEILEWLEDELSIKAVGRMGKDGNIINDEEIWK